MINKIHLDKNNNSFRLIMKYVYDSLIKSYPTNYSSIPKLIQIANENNIEFVMEDMNVNIWDDWNVKEIILDAETLSFIILTSNKLI